MIVRFYNAFSKRKNSTKKPANTDTHYDIDVVLKEDTTIEKPSIILTNREGTASGNPVIVNAQKGDMINPVITFNVMQDGTGTPRPSNPRPIHLYGDIEITLNGETSTPYTGIFGAGTYDVTTGMFTITHAGITLTGADDEHWQVGFWGSGQRFLCWLDGAKIAGELYSEVFRNTSGQAAWSMRVIQDLGHHKLDVYYPSNTYADLNALKSDLSVHPLFVIYELATPQTIQLTSAQIELAQGSNTVSVNGNSTISFGYIAEEIATDYVYAYIPKWDKYYFIGTPAIITNYHVQYDLEEDYLASRKTEIGSTVAQIAFSSSGYDIWKVDHRLPAKVTKTITKSSGSAGVFNGTGSYILGVSNVDAGTSVVCFYAMTQAELQSFMNEVATDTNMKTAVENYCADVWDAIISCTWVPFSISEIPGATASVKVANYTCTTQGKRVTNPPTRASSVTLSIPWTYSDFRRNPPFTSLAAWIPGFGYISLNAADLVSDTSIKFEFMADCVTGDVCCNMLDAVSGNIFQSVSYNAGVSVPLSRYTMDVGGIISAATNLAGNATDTVIAGGLLNPAGVVSGAISTLASGAALAIAANTREVSIKGGIGGRAVIAEGIDVELYAFSVNTEDPDNANYIARWGRPVGQTHAISNHSGYVQCDAASVSLAGDNSERDAINNYLNSGFYYE